MRNSFGLSPNELDAVAAGKSKLDITRFDAAIVDGVNDEVKFITQPDNTESALSLLKLLHWIIVELTMPEYLYGTAMSSTNASVKEQSPVWAKKVEGRQGE
ncbi:MAG: hypothetical protein ACTTH8_05745 [Treponema sp.]